VVCAGVDRGLPGFVMGECVEVVVTWCVGGFVTVESHVPAFSPGPQGGPRGCPLWSCSLCVLLHSCESSVV
jgi:hypothetical protein